MGKIRYPSTRRDNIVETIHGVKVRDPYRWLENNEDPEVQKWLEEQDELGKRVLSGYSQQKDIQKRLSELSLFNSMSTQGIVIRKRRKDHRFFYLFRYQNDPQMRLCYQDGITGDRITLVNPVSIAADGTIKIEWFSPSWDGSYVAYGYSKGGREKSTLRIVKVANSEHLDDIIPNLLYATIIWNKDNSGFYYPFTSFTPEENGRFAGSIFYHRIGTNYEDDICMISGEGRKPERVELYGCENSSWLVYTRNQGVSIDLVVFHPECASEIIVLLENQSKIIPYMYQNSLYIAHESPESGQQISHYALPSPSEDIVIQRQTIPYKTKNPIDLLIPFNESLIIAETENVHSLLTKFDLNTHQSEIIFGNEEITQIVNLSTDGEEIIMFGVNSFYSPIQYKAYSPLTKVSSFFKPKISLIETEYVCKQVWFQSFDGTEIPMFLMYRRDLDTSVPHPTIIHVYGGFGISQHPTYSPFHVLWNELGGYYAIANIRGGGEFGEKWHRDGKLENKMNVIEDVIHAAKWFVDEGYSTHEMIGIRGSSNGGLMVLSAMMKEPQCFGSVYASAPLADMIRYTRDPIASYWINEYGDPSKAEEFHYLHSYSPYHNVSESVEYPPTLFYVAENDARANLMHTTKLLAHLQEKASRLSSDSPIILWVRKQTGHVGGMTMNEWIDFWLVELYWHRINLEI
ncbi:MAG: prolyl oligopeptidase family serine peptidase [Candidatus Lokiarchaeota archaeon]|nr:prolyl oligopeptidase family serine peptidase [Candidatus Lokiarchaeota archaeon]